MALKCPTPEAEAYLESVRKFADAHNIRPQLEEELAFLGNYACHGDDLDHTQCVLTKDFAPQSFAFRMMARPSPTEPYEFWFNGGCLYYAGRESGVGAPQFSVTLSGETGPRWEIHT